MGNLVGNSGEIPVAGKAGFSPFPSLPEGEGERESGSREIPTWFPVSHRKVGKTKVGKTAGVTRYIDGKPVTEPAVPCNPWGLTLTHAEVMDGLCELDGHKAVAQRMGISPNTVCNHTAEIRQRMGVTSTLLAVAKWVRWRAGKGRKVVA